MAEFSRDGILRFTFFTENVKENNFLRFFLRKIILRFLRLRLRLRFFIFLLFFFV